MQYYYTVSDNLINILYDHEDKLKLPIDIWLHNLVISELYYLNNEFDRELNK